MSNETFMLHVELICSDEAAANESLFGLDSCASATQSAGPGVPTYLFFKSAAVTRRIANHTPVAVGLEYLELYLDARAFRDHVASDEWMAGLKRLTRDGNRVERRVYWAGSPPESVRRTRSWTDLNAVQLDTCAQRLFDGTRAHEQQGCEFVSLYLDHAGPDETIAARMAALDADPAWITFVAFRHPTLARVRRLLGVRRPQPLGMAGHAAWQSLLDSVAGGDATVIGIEPAPLAAVLERSRLSVRSSLRIHAGYPLHPFAGGYTPAE